MFPNCCCAVVPRYRFLKTVSFLFPVHVFSVSRVVPASMVYARRINRAGGTTLLLLSSLIFNLSAIEVDCRKNMVTDRVQLARAHTGFPVLQADQDAISTDALRY